MIIHCMLHVRKVTLILLLERNADVSQCGNSGETPLCEKGHTNSVQRLLDSNADVSQYSGMFGATPLYVACDICRIDIVKLLLDTNAGVSQCSGGPRNTPLSAASEGGILIL